MNTMKELFSMQEIEAAYDRLIQKGKRRMHIPLALQQSEDVSSPKWISLLPVGSDGATTCSVEKDKGLFFREIYRLLNQVEYNNPHSSRLKFKKYTVTQLTNTKGKTRQIVKLCLRDQVITRMLLARLNQANILTDKATANPSTFEMACEIVNLMRTLSGQYQIIKTDISSFYHSINRDLLLTTLQRDHGSVIGMPVFNLIKKSVAENKSAHEYTGLPVGMSLSVILGEYYIRAAGIHEIQSGITVFRYVDDILIIADKQLNADQILNDLDQKLAAFDLKRSPEKTVVTQAGEPIRFLGMELSESGIQLDKEKIIQLKKRVQDDINKEFLYYHVANCSGIKVSKPSNKQLVRLVVNEHRWGIRSRSMPHHLKIERFNRQFINGSKENN